MEVELKKRIQTGVVGGFGLILLLIFGGHFGVSLLSVGLSLLMIYEFSKIVLNLSDQKEKMQGMLGATWLVHFIAFWSPRSEYELFLLCFFGFFIYFLFTSPRHKGESFGAHFRELIAVIFGFVYLVFLPLYLPLIHGSPKGVKWTMLFLIIVWSADSAAYFAGKKYGKKKLFPTISPKKTWEGSAGGLGAALVIALLYKFIIFKEIGVGSVIIIALLIGSLSQVGDLCESFFKRAFSAKDSGSILPGHGGIMDRFDGVIFTLPVMYVCVRIFGV